MEPMEWNSVKRRKLKSFLWFLLFAFSTLMWWPVFPCDTWYQNQQNTIRLSDSTHILDKYDKSHPEVSETLEKSSWPFLRNAVGGEVISIFLWQRVQRTEELHILFFGSHPKVSGPVVFRYFVPGSPYFCSKAKFVRKLGINKFLSPVRGNFLQQLERR